MNFMVNTHNQVWELLSPRRKTHNLLPKSLSHFPVPVPLQKTRHGIKRTNDHGEIMKAPIRIEITRYPNETFISWTYNPDA
jgi:hypothetical protein